MDIVLEAIWVRIGTNYYLSSSDSTFTVSASNSTIKLPDTNRACEIIVSTSVNQLYIYSDEFKVHYVRITVQSGRSSNLSIVLSNVHIQAESSIYNYATISMTDAYTLSLTMYKNSVVQGANGLMGKTGGVSSLTNNGEQGQTGRQGGVAIECSKLVINSAAKIVGGQGGVGGTGGSGTFGGSGGTGGQGNYAVQAEQIVINSSDVSLIGGQGGQGGRGGQGRGDNNHGYGGDGGIGSQAVSSNAVVTNANSYSNVKISKGINGIQGLRGDNGFYPVIDPIL